MPFDVIVGYATGLRFFAPEIEGATLWRTLLVLHSCQAVMCRLLAHNQGYSKNFWTAAGFVTGIWAVAVLILLPDRAPRR
jgi:hypothetical protein